MSTEISQRNETAVTPATPMDMLAQAVQNGMSVEVIDKLMTLEERWRANKGRAAFDQAVANAKSRLPVIVKNREGHNNKRYADFAAIAKVVDPVLSECGLSYRFRTRQDDKIHVTCVLSHRDGHSEETTLSGPADTSGSKNAIQAIGSTLTYLQRYSLTQMLGLAASEDDDGKTAGLGETISEDQEKALRSEIIEADADLPKFLKYLGVASLSDLPAAKYRAAMQALSKRKQAAEKNTEAA